MYALLSSVERFHLVYHSISNVYPRAWHIAGNQNVFGEHEWMEIEQLWPCNSFEF